MLFGVCFLCTSDRPVFTVGGRQKDRHRPDTDTDRQTDTCSQVYTDALFMGVVGYLGDGRVLEILFSQCT